MCAFVQLRVRGASAWVCGVRLSGCGVRLHEHLVRFVIHSPQYVQERLCLRTRPARYVTRYGVLSVGPSRRSCSFCTQKKLFFLYSASSNHRARLAGSGTKLQTRSISSDVKPVPV